MVLAITTRHSKFSAVRSSLQANAISLIMLSTPLSCSGWMAGRQTPNCGIVVNRQRNGHICVCCRLTSQALTNDLHGYCGTSARMDERPTYQDLADSRCTIGRTADNLVKRPSALRSQE